MQSSAPIDTELRQIAWANLLHVHARLVAVMDRELMAAGLLSMSGYDVLLTLKRAPGRRLRLSELAARVVLSRSGLTRLLDRIEAAGHLRRESAAEDRRGAYAILLPAGDEALKATWRVYEGLILEHFGSVISDNEARVMHEVFTRLLAAPVVESEPINLTVKRRREG